MHRLLVSLIIHNSHIYIYWRYVSRRPHDRPRLLKERLTDPVPRPPPSPHIHLCHPLHLHSSPLSTHDQTDERQRASNPPQPVNRLELRPAWLTHHWERCKRSLMVISNTTPRQCITGLIVGKLETDIEWKTGTRYFLVLNWYYHTATVCS